MSPEMNNVCNWKRCPLLSGLLLVTMMFQLVSASWEWPVWPNESEMNGMSYGPFPFWCDTSNSTKGAYKFLCLDRDADVAHHTRVLYSYSRMAQVSFRDACNLSQFGGVSNVTCAHRFMPNGKAYITYGDRENGYCCQSFGHLPQSNPIPIPHPEFMNTCLRKTGPTPYEGLFFKGNVYNYTDMFSELPTYFWYLTAADDERPIAQGEGCVIDRSRRHECSNDGHVSKLGNITGDPAWTLFEYDQFTESWFDDSEFDLPPSCLGPNLKQCYNMECDEPTTTVLQHEPLKNIEAVRMNPRLLDPSFLPMADRRPCPKV